MDGWHAAWGEVVYTCISQPFRPAEYPYHPGPGPSAKRAPFPKGKAENQRRRIIGSQPDQGHSVKSANGHIRRLVSVTNTIARWPYGRAHRLVIHNVAEKRKWPDGGSAKQLLQHYRRMVCVHWRRDVTILALIPWGGFAGCNHSMPYQVKAWSGWHCHPVAR